MAGIEDGVKKLLIEELETYRVRGEVSIPPDRVKEFETKGLEIPLGISFSFETILEVKEGGGFGIIASSIKLPPTIEAHLLEFLITEIRKLPQKD